MPPANRVSEALRRRITRAYTTPGHPAAFSAPARVAECFNITERQAKWVLEHVEGYTLHREYKQPKKYNPYYVRSRREQVQGDLIDISKIKGDNDDITFLLVLIDIFTKYVWVYPIKSKSAAVMELSMRRWLGEIDTPPKKLMTDRGLEFTNRRVQHLLRSRNVEWQAALGTMKAAIAERVNKTLQILIYKYLTQNETIRYIDVLPQLVQTYNRRGHRTLEDMSPEDADRPANQNRVRAIFQNRYTEIAQGRTKNPKFRVGDLVRLKTEPKKITSSAHAYAEQFHGEYFSIIRINRTMPVPLYYLRSLDTGEHIRGGLYANELQLQRGDVWKIERVLNRRTRRGVREILVKWKYFSEQHNEWIPETNVVRGF